MNSKTYKKNSMFNKYIYAIIAIVIMVAEIIGLVLLHNKDTSNGHNIDTNVNEQKSNQSEDIVTESKEYYDFIDTEYGTFDFTEEEFVRRFYKNINNGASYEQQGYERTKATVPNQYNYAKVNWDGIDTMGITINPSNGKVSNIKIEIYKNIGGELTNENAHDVVMNLVAGIVGFNARMPSENEREECLQIIDECGNGIAIGKGLQIGYAVDTNTKNGLSAIIAEAKVVLDKRSNSTTSKDKEENTQDRNNNNVNNKTEFNNNEEVSTTISPSNNTNNTVTSNNITTPSSSNNSTTNVPSNNSNIEQNETKYTTVPNLVGLDYNTATSKMTEAKIETGAIEKEYIFTSNSSKDNTIAEQSLKAGTKVEEWESMERLTIYKYSNSISLDIPIKVVKKNITNKEELLGGKEIVVKYNDEQVCVEYIDNSHFSGNDLVYKYPCSLIVSKPINKIKVDIYIGADLLKTETITIGNLEGKRITDNGSHIRIDLNEVTINITD